MSKKIAIIEQAKMYLTKGLLASIINHKEVEKIAKPQDTNNHFQSPPSLYSYYAAQAMSALIQKYDDIDKISEIS